MNDIKNGKYVVNGNIYWYKDGLLHCENGPAIEWSDGTQHWYHHGKLHREDGPANILIKANGESKRSWYVNGELHREDGPAIEINDHYQEWWIHGIKYKEKEFNQYLEKKKLNDSLQQDLEEKNSKSKAKL